MNSATRGIFSGRQWLNGLLALSLCLALGIGPALAQEKNLSLEDRDEIEATLKTLRSFIELGKDQQADIKLQEQLIEAEESPAEQTLLKQRLAQMNEEQLATKSNFREIAAGTDLSILHEPETAEFNLQEEILALLKPAFEEMREMTSRVRQKSALREKISFYEERLPVVEKAIANISRLQAANEDEALETALEASLQNWTSQQAFMQSELQAAEVQFNKLLASEASLTETSQRYLKSFFTKRGLYLFAALLGVVIVLLLSRYSYLLMKRLIPGFRARHRSFHIRVIELSHRFATVFLMVLAPMLVFYIVEDWVFFSLGILLLFGFLWTLVRALPHIWRQIHLFLNIGSVREGERIDFEGLPWQVERINLYCDLVNPVAGLNQRVPINDMVDLKSRPYDNNEPWFPCMKGDWVILGNGLRGKVTGISQEMVQLIERGGSRVTYLMQDFLGQSPRTLATNFRIKEIIGLSYSLQAHSTGEIPETLHAYITRRASEEGYREQLVNLRVEFAEAGSSSLNIVVIADFKGELGDLYNRLRRSVQRWCVDACTEYGWEIPFPQLTLHGAVNTRAEIESTDEAPNQEGSPSPEQGKN